MGRICNRRCRTTFETIKCASLAALSLLNPPPQPQPTLPLNAQVVPSIAATRVLYEAIVELRGIGGVRRYRNAADQE